MLTQCPPLLFPYPSPSVDAPLQWLSALHVFAASPTISRFDLRTGTDPNDKGDGNCWMYFKVRTVSVHLLRQLSRCCQGELRIGETCYLCILSIFFFNFGLLIFAYWWKCLFASWQTWKFLHTGKEKYKRKKHRTYLFTTLHFSKNVPTRQQSSPTLHFFLT